MDKKLELIPNQIQNIQAIDFSILIQKLLFQNLNLTKLKVNPV